MLKKGIQFLYFLFVASVFIGPAISFNIFYPLRIITPVLFLFTAVLYLRSYPKFKSSLLSSFFWVFTFLYFILTLLSSLVGYVSLSIVPEFNDVLNFLMIFLLFCTYLFLYELDLKRFFKVLEKSILIMYVLLVIVCLIEFFTGFHFSSSIFDGTNVKIPTGFFTNPNDLACVLTLMFIFLFTHYKPNINILTLVITLLHFAIVIYTSSRISLFVLILFFIVFKTKKVITFSCFLLALFFLFKSNLPSSLKQNLSLIEKGLSVSKNDNSKNVRLNLYLNGIQSVKNSFGLGYGVNSSSSYYKSLRGDKGLKKFINPHSFQIELLINSGVVVLFCYLILNFYIFFLLVKKSKYEQAFHVIFFNISLFSSSSSLFVWPIYLFLFIYFIWADDKIALIENE